jgi:hypothetical protein
MLKTLTLAAITATLLAATAPAHALISVNGGGENGVSLNGGGINGGGAPNGITRNGGDVLPGGVVVLGLELPVK